MIEQPTSRNPTPRLGAVGFCLLLLITLILFWIKGGNLRLVIPIVFIKLVGLAAGVVLVMGDLEHPFFSRICPRGDKMSCFAVIRSPAATLFGRIHMADLGMLYFCGGLILIFFSAPHPYFFYYLYLLALFNLITLPYTVFSVVYQAFVVKKWCALCLIVLLVFWLEFIFFFKFLKTGLPPLSLEDLYSPVWSFTLPTFFWLLCRSRIKELLARGKPDNGNGPAIG